MEVPARALVLCMPTPELIDAATSGSTWLNGRVAFRRELSLQEKHLVTLLGGAA